MVDSYCYDANGNVVNFSDQAANYTCPSTKGYTYDGANQELTSPAGSQFAVDAAGDETSASTTLPDGHVAATRTESWSTTQQQTGISINAGTGLGSVYLGSGNNDLLTSGVTSTDSDQLVNGPIGFSEVDRTSSGTTSTKTYVERDPSGAIIAERTSAGAHFYTLTDIQGSILDLLDANGNVADSYTYNEFGTHTTHVGNFPQPFGYTGAYTNPTTGLIHLGARYYDPTLNRFTQPDPQTHLNDPNQNNTYGYAGDDPINGSDPTGAYNPGDSCIDSPGGCQGSAANEAPNGTSLYGNGGDNSFTGFSFNSTDAAAGKADDAICAGVTVGAFFAPVPLAAPAAVCAGYTVVSVYNEIFGG